MVLSDIIDLALVAAYYQDPNFSDSALVLVSTRMSILMEVVDVKDLVAIAGEIDAVAAGPPLRQKSAETSGLTAENLTRWLALGEKALDSQNLDTAKGISVPGGSLSTLDGCSDRCL